MASVTRQPFAPLDGTRLQSLTSLKNRQSVLSPNSGAKRKAVDPVDTDDSENVDPGAFKRARGNKSPLSQEILKPSSYLLTRTSTPVKDAGSVFTPKKSSAAVASSFTSPRRRAVLQPKSPAKLSTSTAPPLSAPAGRSPTRGKRSGILSSRRNNTGPYSRVDRPLLSTPSTSSAAAPFSLDAALKGTVPSYAARQSIATPTPIRAPSRASKLDNDLHEPEMKASWFFDIHEDTPEQETTNLLQHSTCVLDISSDDDTEEKAMRARAEGRDKENVPPADDVSQTTASRSVNSAGQTREDDMVVEKKRIALGEMDASAFYAAGCDERSVIFVPGDEDDEVELQARDHAQAQTDVTPTPAPASLDSAPDVRLGAVPGTKETKETCRDAVDELMGKSKGPASKAVASKSSEGSSEQFELWAEDGS
ncbi:hypothetical protein ACRALDRAFT_1077027 [Sodiomyces alcalophilus JCM 7366]|uniref:uncharacterized protein n=1 Tax=Sodiomyces alcalophilus JCM 7366 TaxID=591952 RepID=UPI0039B5D7F5